MITMYTFQLAILLVIRVLCIGNSFSWDAVEQELVPLCDAENVQVEIHNLYYGGCSLQQHAGFLLKDTAAYSHRVCTNNRSSIRHRQSRDMRGNISLKDALRDGKFDYISFQQASHDSGIRSTYEPWLSLLIDSVRAYQPDARLCWMQTWAYSRDAKQPAFPRYHNDQQEMWDSIQSCTRYVKEVVDRHPSHGKWLLIPCGKAIQLGRSSSLGDTFCRDGYHLNYTYGRYTAACVWYEIITKKDVRRNPQRNPEMTRQQQRIAQKCAHKAVKNVLK